MKIALEQVLAELLPVGPTALPDELQLLALFDAEWPDQRAHLQSYRAKPDCSCKNDILKALATNETGLAKLLDRLTALRGKTYWHSGDVPLPPQAGPTPNLSAGRPKTWHLAGQVRRIVDTPEAYARMLRDLAAQGGRYTGLSCVARPDTHLDIFFY